MARSDLEEVGALIDKAREIACTYKRITGRPLGITGEVAEFEAVRLLGLELAPVRAPGYDALRGTERIQIKGRVVGEKPKPGQKLGAIKTDKDWESAMFVALDDDLRPTGIWEASRTAIEKALAKTDAKARKGGVLAVSEFKAIGRRVWPE